MALRIYTVAPTGDDPLTPDDAVNVLEEILEAMNQSRFLGLKLNVPDYIVTGIHTQYTDPKDRLYYVVVEFLKQVDPRPTWRTIAAALRSSAVGLPQLAMRVEAAHFPDPISTRGIPPETTTSAGIHQIMTIILVSLCVCPSPVPKPQATSDIPPLTIPETSSTQTSGERDMNKLDYSLFKLSSYYSQLLEHHLSYQTKVKLVLTLPLRVQSSHWSLQSRDWVTTCTCMSGLLIKYAGEGVITCGWFQSKCVMYYGRGMVLSGGWKTPVTQ